MTAKPNTHPTHSLLIENIGSLVVVSPGPLVGAAMRDLRKPFSVGHVIRSKRDFMNCAPVRPFPTSHVVAIEKPKRRILNSLKMFAIWWSRNLKRIRNSRAFSSTRG